jgi:hypothetical protein
MSLPEVIRITNKKKVAEIAQAVLDGSMRISDAARQLNQLRGDPVGLDSLDKDFVPFLLVETDTSRFPESEITASEVFYRDHVLEAARRLVARFAREDRATPYEY